MHNKLHPKIILGMICVVMILAVSRIMPTGLASEGVYYPVEVVQIIHTQSEDNGNEANMVQTVKVRIISGQEKDNELLIPHGENSPLTEKQLVRVGEKYVVVKEVTSDGRESLRLTDRYRIPQLVMIALIFVFVVLLFAGRQGLGAIVGLLCSAVVILQFIVPNILSGKDPVIISLLGAVVILCVTMYLAHGFKLATTVSLLATFITLTIAGILSYITVMLMHLNGTGSEEAYMLQLSTTAVLNLRGLLLGGMMLGIVGILDDVTTSQVASIFVLSAENKQLGVKALIERGFFIGREHIASLVNTLVLAYAGVSFPLFIFFVLNPLAQPAWVIFNSEYLSEEIVRTFAGSMGLIFAVPIATILAAFFAKKFPDRLHHSFHRHD